MKKVILVSLFLLFCSLSYAQVGINTTDPDLSSILDVVSSNRGVLLPRVALTALNVDTPVADPANSLTVFNTATAGTAPNNVTPGYYYWDTDTWVRVGVGAGVASSEPWFGVDDNMAATTNTEDIYHLGRIGIGTDNPTEKFEVDGSVKTLFQITPTSYSGFYSGNNALGLGVPITVMIAQPNEVFDPGTDQIAFIGVTENLSRFGTTSSVLGDEKTSLIEAKEDNLNLSVSDNVTNEFAQIDISNSGSSISMSTENSSGNNRSQIDLTPENRLEFSFNTLGAGTAYRFPRTNGALGEVMVNDGSGNLNWAAPALGASSEPWKNPDSSPATNTSTDIGYTAGNVGIGVLNPSNTLHVSAASNPLRLEGVQNGSGVDDIMLISTAGVVRKISTTAAVTGLNLDNTNDAWVNRTATSRVELGTKSNGTSRTTGTEFVALDNGNIGVGLVLPTNKVHITATANPLRLEGLQAASAPLTDRALIVDNTGVVKLGDIGSTPSGSPWFGTDDDMAATTNTEDIYHLGRVGIGTDNPENSLEIHGTDATGGDADVDVFSYGSEVTVFHVYRANGSQAAPTAVSGLSFNKNSIFSLEGYGYDGTAYQRAAGIRFGIYNNLSGITTGPSDMPGFIEFQTTPDGSKSLSTRMTIAENGNVGIGTGTSKPTSKLQVVGLPVFATVAAAQASSTITVGAFYVLSAGTPEEQSVVRVKR